MPKIEPKASAPVTDASTVSVVDAAPAVAPPRLGSIVQVKVAPGVMLINNDTGQYYADDTPTLAQVTITTLRRLADGDLVLC